MNKNLLTEMIHRHDEWEEIKDIISVLSTLRTLSDKHKDGIPYSTARQRLHPRIKWEESELQLIMIIAALDGYFARQDKKGPGRKGKVIIIPAKSWVTESSLTGDEK